jgi:hypothetical protein
MVWSPHIGLASLRILAWPNLKEDICISWVSLTEDPILGQPYRGSYPGSALQRVLPISTLPEESILTNLKEYSTL